jgi:RNA polymerase sigma-70 factor (ECF subfamily)
MGIELETPAMGTEAPTVAVDDPEEAFRRLSSRHVQSAYRLAWAILGDERDAQDAAQDAFTTAWRQRSTLHEVGRFDAWFGRILVNCCRDRLRRRARTPWAGPLDAEPSLPDQSGAALERHELYRQVARLDPDQRIVVILRYWKDMAVDDIAECLGVPAGTVKSRLHRSLARLRAAMEDVR